MEFLVFQFFLLPCALGATEKTLCLLAWPYRIFMHTDKSPLSLLCLRLSNPSSLSFTSCSNPLIILVHWTCSNMSRSLVVRSPGLDPAVQQHLTSAEQRWRIPSLTLCLTRPEVLLAAFAARAHCWLAFNLSTRILIFACFTVSAPSQRYLDKRPHSSLSYASSLNFLSYTFANCFKRTPPIKRQSTMVAITKKLLRGLNLLHVSARSSSKLNRGILFSFVQTGRSWRIDCIRFKP